eukprot:7839667-Alexandrium_andersonii.AAC.1
MAEGIDPSKGDRQNAAARTSGKHPETLPRNRASGKHPEKAQRSARRPALAAQLAAPSTKFRVQGSIKARTQSITGRGGAPRKNQRARSRLTPTSGPFRARAKLAAVAPTGAYRTASHGNSGKADLGLRARLAQTKRALARGTTCSTVLTKTAWASHAIPPLPSQSRPLWAPHQ